MNKEKLHSSMLLLLHPDDGRTFKEQWDEFKYSYRLKDVRQLLAISLEACICGDYPDFESGEARGNIAFFFWQLMALLEARYKKDIEQDEQYRKFALGTPSNEDC